MREIHRKKLFDNQRGQAAVFVLALLGVVLLCVVFLYHSGRVTSEKMQLQNAADAAAFSAITLQARSLNFSAYTNRAMVANEVAVGQLVGLLSWTDQLTQAEIYGDAYAAAVEAAGSALAALLIETIGGAAVVEIATEVIVSTIETIGAVLTTVGEAMEVFLEAVAGPFIKGLSLINKAYSTSQMIYHGATYGAVVKSLYQSLEDNTEGTRFNRTDIVKKDLGGAQISDLGIIAVVGHIPSFWSGYTKIYSSPTSSGKKKKEPKKKKEDPSEKKKKEDPPEKKKKPAKKKKDDEAKTTEGMGRFAATVREARDPFSSGDKSKNTNRDWSIELDLKFYKSLPIPFPPWKVKIGAEYALGAESYGGTELRYKNGYNWTAADSSVMGSKLKIFGKWYPFPVELPFGSGGFQAPQSLESVMLPTDILPTSPVNPYGNPKPQAYGEAGRNTHLLAWFDVVKEMEENIIPDDPYMGLQPYRDMSSMTARTPGESDYPFQAPYFMVGFTRTLHDVDKRGPKFSGSLDLTRYDSNTNIDRLGAIARAELYFLRPKSPSYFSRIDGRGEKPNVFSPFWQARLVDTGNRDRFLALALQQEVLWLTEKEKNLIGGSVLDKINKFIGRVLNAISGVVDRVLRMFL